MDSELDTGGRVGQIRDELPEQAEEMLAGELGDYFRVHGAASEKRLKQAARCEEVRVLSEMDGLDLADPEVMAGAWPNPEISPAPSPPASEPSASGPGESP